MPDSWSSIACHHRNMGFAVRVRLYCSDVASGYWCRHSGICGTQWRSSGFDHVAGTVTAVYFCLGGVLLGSIGTLIISLLPRNTAWPVVVYCLTLATVVLGLSCVSRAKGSRGQGSMMWSRYKVRKVRQIPIVERMWQAIAQQIAAADPKPLRGFGRLSSGVSHQEGAMKTFAAYVITACLSSTALASSITENTFWNKEFSAEAVNGVFVLCKSSSKSCATNNLARASKEYLPASTFKIPNAIIGLETGVIKNEHQIFKWDGKPRAMKQWERDLSLRGAIQVSAVPVFQQIAREVGEVRMQKYLKNFHMVTRISVVALTNSGWRVSLEFPQLIKWSF